MKKIPLSALTSLIIALSASAQIASDDFDYTAGAELGGQGVAGSGWASGWVTNGTDTSLTLSNPTGSAEGALATTLQRNFRTLSSAPTSGTVFFRYDISASGIESSLANDEVLGLALFTGTGTEHAFFGIRNDFFRLNVNGDTAYDSAASTGGDGEYTLLLELTFNDSGANESLRGIVVDDVNSFDESNSIMISNTPATNFTFDTVRIVKNGADFTGSYDNLIIGSTLADVGIMAIPEPETFALLAGFGSLCMIAFRRRK